MTFQVKGLRRRVETATDRQERIEWWSQERLRGARIMVVGAGALGNEVIKNLTLLGVGYLLVVDFDVIEVSNLSRTALFRHEDLGRRKAPVAAARARELCVDPATVIEALDGDVVWDVGLGCYRRVDLVLGCLDNIEARLAVNRACILTRRPFIDGGIRGLAGSVYVFTPPFEVCFSCTTTRRERQAAVARYDSCFQILRRNYAEGRMATVQVTSALIAALQVEQAVQWLHGRLHTGGMRLQYDGGSALPYFEVSRVHRRPGCECGELQPLPAAAGLPGAVQTMTLRECLAALTAAGLTDPVLKFPCSFVPYLYCGNCGRQTTLLQPIHRIATEQVQCAHCQVIGDRNTLQLMRMGDSMDLFDPDLADYREEILDLSLHRLGFPRLPTLHVQDGDGRSHYFEFRQDGELALPNATGAETPPAPGDETPPRHPGDAPA